MYAILHLIPTEVARDTQHYDIIPVPWLSSLHFSRIRSFI